MQNENKWCKTTHSRIKAKSKITHHQTH